MCSNFLRKIKPVDTTYGQRVKWNGSKKSALALSELTDSLSKVIHAEFSETSDKSAPFAKNSMPASKN
jgi:hypothetical protein